MKVFRIHTDTFVIFALSERAGLDLAAELGERPCHIPVSRLCEITGPAAEVLQEQPNGAMYINPAEATQEQLRAFPL
jgi:hypothetical protein